MKPLVRFSVFLLFLCALLKISEANCGYGQCAENQTLTADTTTVKFESNAKCNLSIGHDSTGEGSITSLTPGTIHEVFISCLNCCKEVTTKPETVTNLHVTDVTTTSLLATWNEPEGKSSLYRVSWTKGQINTTGTSLNISGLNAGVQECISVVAVAIDNHTEGQNMTTCRYTQPNIVEGLTVGNETTSSISLSWTKPVGGSSFYRVQWTNGKTNNNNNVTETKIRVTELTAGVRYHFTVITVAGDNTTESAMAETFHYTKPNIIQNLTVTELTTSSMYVTWSKPEGGSSFYRVQWTNGEMNETLKVTETHVDITNLTAGVQYKISVTAVAEDNYTDGNSAMVSHYTKPNIVEGLTVDQVTTSSISLSWTKPKGGSSFYRVQWTNGKTNNNNNVTETKIRVTELTAGVRYHFTVITVAGDNRTESAMAETFHYTKPNIIQNLTVTELTTSSMFVTWSKPEGGSSFYRVQWTNGEMNETLKVTETHVDITNLTAGVQYKISVTAVAEDNYTDGNSAMVSHYTKPNIVEGLTVDQVTTSSISLSWTKPKGGSSFYRVQWTNGKTNNNNNVTETKIRVTELTAGVRYHFTVITVAGDNRTESAMAETFHYTKPNIIQNLTVTELTTSSMFVTWSKPEGGSSFYRVQWTNGEMNETLKVTETHVDITNLTAGVQYKISVTAVAEDNYTDGNSAMVSHYTKPNIVEGLTVDQVTTSSISLSWTKPKGGSSFYRVQWTNGKTNNNNNVTENEIRVTELTAGVRYHFTVITVAGDNRTESAMAEMFHYTKPNIIQNLTVTELTTSSMYVTWSKPEGGSSFYRVQWTNGEMNETLKVTETHVDITNLTAGVQYKISVTAVAEDNYTEGNSAMVSHYTKPNIVEGLTVDQVTTSSISLSWTKPKGGSSFYRVQWTNGKTNNNNNVTENEIRVTELTAGVRYHFTVITVAGDNTTESAMAETFHYTKPNIIQNLTVTELTTSSMYVTWSKPEGGSSFYRVQWTNGEMNETLKVTETHVDITNLTAGVQYKISVTAVAEDNYTEGNSAMVSHYTKPNIVEGLTVDQVTTSSISLSWTKPKGGSSFYRVQWTNGKTNNNNNVTETKIRVTELTAGVRYHFTVITVAGDNRTESAMAETFHYTKPNIIQNLTVTELTTSSMFVTWSKPEGGSSFYRVQWTNGEMNETLKVTETHVDITNLTAGVQYKISVTAVAEDNYTDGNSAMVSHYTKPGKIGSHDESITKSSIYLNWTKPPGEVFEYSVTWHNGGTVNSEKTNSTFVVLPNLIPGTSYTIQIIAVNGAGDSGEPRTFTSVTKPAAVRDLAIIGTTSSSLSLNWTKPQGNATSYIVRWTTGENSKNNTTTETFFTINDLNPGYQYSITVVAVASNSLNTGEEKSESTFTRPVKPVDITVGPRGTDNLYISWTLPHGRVDHYVVNISNDELMYDNNSRTNNQTFVFTGLSPGRVFDVTVTAVAGNFKETSDQSSFATYPTPPGPLNISHRTNSSLYVIWETPALIGNAPNISYSITYSDKDSVKPQDTMLNKKELSLLSSGTRYNISVQTIGPERLMSSDVGISTFTLPNPVLNLESSTNSTTSVEVKWSPPHGVQDYYVYLVEIVTPKGNWIVNNPVSTNRAYLSDLKPGTKYNISVRTIAAQGIESADEFTVVYTRPAAVSNITVENVTTTSVQLSWLRLSDHNPSYSYLVMALRDNILVHNGSTENETYTFSNLCPGSLYTFKVITEVDGIKSSEERANSYTRPALVSNIVMMGNDDETTHLSVSWLAAECQVDSYTVLLHRDGDLVGNKTDLSNTTENHLFVELTPGVLYCVEVVTKSGPFQNKSAKVCNATFPNPPGTIMVESQTVDSINFTWSLPENMEHLQYNFSVSITNDSFKNNWFLLPNLQSGSLHNISVVTVGVWNYESSAVTAQNYTKPYPVTVRADKTEITTNTVTLVWEQQESKSHYSYVVEVSNGAPSQTVKNTTTMITGLVSGSNYIFTVTTQTVDGTQADSVTVSYFTRPYGVRKLQAETLNTTAIRLFWDEPLEYKPEYTYRVETTDCGAHKNETLTGNNLQISALTPGTKCSFCVFVRAADGIEGEANCTPQYTKPETVVPSISSQGSNSSVLVSWTKPLWRVEHFKVYLNSSFGDVQVQRLNSSDTFFLFDGLSAGRNYSAMVTTLSGPFEEPSRSVTNATFPNPPGLIEVLNKTTSSLYIKWAEATLMDGASFSYQLSNISAQGGEHISTNNTNFAFTSLQSGTPYNISVATVGVLDFQSVTVQINMVTTRPFKVNSLEAFEDEEIIWAKWLNPDQYKESYRFNLTLQSSAETFDNTATKDNQFNFTKLNPGSPYNISVITETFDGTQSDPTLISICTKASPVTKINCEVPNKPNAEVVLSWTCPRGVYSGFQVSVNDTVDKISPLCNHTVSNLRHFTEYRLTVETKSCGRPSSMLSVVCRTGITVPPTPDNNDLLVKLKDIEHNKFSLQINSSLLNNTNGPVTYVGVLMTDKNLADTSDFTSYLGKTYTEWKNGDTQAYLATVKETKFKTRSGESELNIAVGTEETWEGYTNGVLQANGKYQYAIVLFTDLNLKEQRVNVAQSLVSVTQFSAVFYLPTNLVVIGIAAGATLGIFFVLFIILIGFIIYWKRISKKESPDIQIHSIRSKSAAVRVEDFEAYYKKQTADSNCGFAEEFEDLKAVGTGQPKTIALSVENKPKNRYNNVLPYDSSRVKLSIIHGSPFDDYINANYMPGYNSRKEFIAAQGPLPQTVNEFWRMIWEKNVQTLVMLTRCNEQGRVKCEQYWEHGTKHFENIIVTETSKIPLKDWTIRDFNVKNVKTAETRPLRHFHLTAWPDHGVPESTELLISFRHLVREHMDQYSRHSPAVVHCSAGVGRTGTFIAIDHLIFQIERENMVDVFGIVHDLRMHRPLMVQTEDQYVFLNQCAMDIIRSRTGTNVDLIYQNTAALSIYENVEPKKGFPRNGYYNA